jgi:hypothetical protein
LKSSEYPIAEIPRGVELVFGSGRGWVESESTSRHPSTEDPPVRTGADMERKSNVFILDFKSPLGKLKGSKNRKN